MQVLKRPRVSASAPAPVPLLPILSPGKGSVIRWTVSQNQWISRGARMGSFQLAEAREGGAAIVSLEAPHDGRVQVFRVQEGASVGDAGVELCSFYFCEHPVLMEGMCGRCGNTPSRAGGGDPRRAEGSQTVNVSGGYSLVINRDEQLVNHSAVTRRLFSKKKLSLVLDLDHTLLHCTDDPRGKRFAERKRANVLVFELGEKELVLKTRPGLDKFLQAMDEKFEMYIYTAATRAYAKLVCEYLDPTGKYFGERIVARTDTPELGVEKSLERLFPVDSSMVIIVDDRDVWGGSPNLLTCEPFHFFHGMHEVNNDSWQASTGGSEPAPPGSSETPTPPLNQASGGEDCSALLDAALDPGLTRVKSILDEVWRSFFYPVETDYRGDASARGSAVDVETQLRGQGADVKVILASIHARVLEGKTVAFDPKTPRVDWLYQRAKVCGAKCVNEVRRGLTHLVAGGDTALARIAREKGVFVVKPTWLELSDHYWAVQKEENFAIFASPGPAAGLGLAAGPPLPTPPTRSDAPLEQEAQVKAAREEEALGVEQQETSMVIEDDMVLADPDDDAEEILLDREDEEEVDVDEEA